MRTVAAVLWLLVTVQSVFAQSYYCDRPRKPYIPIGLGADYNSMQTAQYDVERYLKRLKEYVA